MRTGTKALIALTAVIASSLILTPAKAELSPEGKRVKAELVRVIKQSIEKPRTCKTARLNPGSVLRSQLSIALRAVRPGVNPNTSITATKIRWQYIYKGTVEGGCAKLEGSGHHK